MTNELLIELPLELVEITYGGPQDAEIVQADATVDGGLPTVAADVAGNLSADFTQDDLLAAVDVTQSVAEVELEIEGDS